MKVLVIGKPTYNFILQVDSFIKEGSKTLLNENLELAGGPSVYIASLLSKWGMEVYLTGVIGNDSYGQKIKKQLEEAGVNISFLETNYEVETSTNHIIINKQSGSSTEIINNKDVYLTKYKYDFTPDYILIDGTDVNGALAALNNYPNVPSILFANKISKEIYDLSKKSNYVVCTTRFAEELTKLKLETKKPKSLVNFMQRIKDLNKAEYTIMLRNSGAMYVSDNQVKLLPAVKVNKIIDDTHSSYLFFAAYVYGIMNNYGPDNSVKIANAAGGISLTKLGPLNAMLDHQGVLDLAGLQLVTQSQETPETKQEEPQTIETI